MLKNLCLDRSVEDVILNISEEIKGFKSKKLSKKTANNFLDISELRNEVEEVREKIVSQKSPKIGKSFLKIF